MSMDRMKPGQLENAQRLFVDFLADESSSGKIPIEEIAKGLRAVLVSGAVIAAAPTDTAAQTIQIRPFIEQSREFFSKSDIVALAKNVFHEARGEGPLGQLAVVQVTLARLLAQRWGDTVEKVIYAPFQFSWTLHSHAELAKREGEGGLTALVEVLASHFTNKDPATIVKELARITGLPENTLFYKSSELDENNVDEKRMSDKTKEAFRGMKKVGQIAKHEFYVEQSLKRPKAKKPPHTKKTKTAIKN